MAWCLAEAGLAIDRTQQSEGAAHRAADGKALTDAHDAWAQGDYIAALKRYISILNAPGGDAHRTIAALRCPRP